MKPLTIKKLYIDSNVLINYCTSQIIDKTGLEYLFKKRRKEVLFTSSLAIVQTISILQTKKANRKAFSREQTVKVINKLRQKLTIINLTKEDVVAGISFNNSDLEDNIHYVLSKKAKCDAIITNNTSDFDYFKDISVIRPKRSILSMRIK